jgi:2-C-methyl-D-erythritol 2,4-cyclodiphosphate synthase
MKIGFGFDVHQLKAGYDLWIGGIRLEHTKGAVGHSDADVMIHAICDALLGAANLNDIGFHFPDTSAEFKNIDSKILLRKVMQLIGKKITQLETSTSRFVYSHPKLQCIFL